MDEFLKPRKYLEQQSTGDFSRMEFDSLSLNYVKFLLAQLLRVAEILLDPTVTSKGLWLIFMGHQNLPRIVVGDEIQIYHILLHIVGKVLNDNYLANLMKSIVSLQVAILAGQSQWNLSSLSKGNIYIENDGAVQNTV